MKLFSAELAQWANHWYNYSFNDKDSEAHEEMNELKRIIQRMERKGL